MGTHHWYTRGTWLTGLILFLFACAGGPALAAGTGTGTGTGTGGGAEGELGEQDVGLAGGSAPGAQQRVGDDVDAAVGQDKFLVKTKPDFQGRRGDACRLAFDTGRWHLFDRDAGLVSFVAQCTGAPAPLTNGR